MSALTERLKSNLNNPVSSQEFDLYAALDEVLGGVGLTASDSGAIWNLWINRKHKKF
jgi:hypothetical protein